MFPLITHNCQWFVCLVFLLLSNCSIMWRLSTNCSRKKQNNHTQHQTLIPKCPKWTQNTIVHCYFLFLYTEVCVEVGDMIWYDMTWFLSKVYFGVNRTFKMIEVGQISSVWISGSETRREVNKLSSGLDFKCCLHTSLVGQSWCS